MILAVPELTQGLAAFSLEVDGGGVEEDQVKSGEERPVQTKQPFFDQILGAARRKGRGVGQLAELRGLYGVGEPFFARLSAYSIGLGRNVA